ncbi:MAG TPA: hypothetical protein VLK23_11895 [Thermodesulfobacteriota bacterium]|nr:hypothetical protein [Thermodesulfobacteriota bacterium]
MITTFADMCQQTKSLLALRATPLPFLKEERGERKVLIDALMFFKQTLLSMVDCFLWARAVHKGLEIMRFDEVLGKKVSVKDNP